MMSEKRTRKLLRIRLPCKQEEDIHEDLVAEVNHVQPEDPAAQFLEREAGSRNC